MPTWAYCGSHGLDEVIFPASVLQEKMSGVQAWRAETKICKGCSERNDSLILRKTRAQVMVNDVGFFWKPWSQSFDMTIHY